jgi:hypothetical protein
VRRIIKKWRCRLSATPGCGLAVYKTVRTIEKQYLIKTLATAHNTAKKKKKIFSFLLALLSAEAEFMR